MVMFVSPDVCAAAAMLSDRTREDLTLHPAPELGEVRAAALVFARHRVLHRLVPRPVVAIALTTLVRN
jgi:hypothetical protein